MIIVADASPLISFAILNKLELLDKLLRYAHSNCCYKEITKENKKYSDKLNSFAKNKTKKVENKLAVDLLQKDLDLGESEAIVLAKENDISDILMDEYKGRKIAKDNGLHPIGTLGVLIQAKKKKLIKKVKPEIDTLINNHIRILDDLYSTALELAGEE